MRATRVLLIAAGAGSAAFVANRSASRSGAIDFERLIERMPENAPPKWMFQEIFVATGSGPCSRSSAC